MPKLNVFWFRRDLRLEDNAGLYHALKSGLPVLPVFIFDRNILDELEPDDARVTFIHRALADLNTSLNKHKASLYFLYDTPEKAWETLLDAFDIGGVYTNHDYEPYARMRDERIGILLASKNIPLHTFKDQVIFEKDEIVKDDGKPYTVFTPYSRKWHNMLKPAFHLKPYPTLAYAERLLPGDYPLPSLNSIGFTESNLEFPDKEFESILPGYSRTRDLPAIHGTSKISVHLRFGTISIRQVVAVAYHEQAHTWLNELIWRDFYQMILWHFPETADHAFKPAYDRIRWRNNEDEFKAWCEGKTGYPIVDAGMRQLNATGWMHNRVRMIVASFLCKHLLIDWRWGEAYFAKKLIDYEQASNVGGWQWAAGSGNDAAPYFRVFNPELQQKKFDPDLKYVRQWVPEFDDPFQYPQPVIEHKKARERALNVYKNALG